MIQLAPANGRTGQSPRTLAADVGGTAVKATVLDHHGEALVPPVRVPTPRPCPPSVLVGLLSQMVKPLPEFERISVGFPGLVRDGRVLTAPHLGGGKWQGYPLAVVLASRFGCPVQVRNDTEVYGLGVVAGRRLELVVTLGTGVGTALFQNGRPTPHLELAHHPLRSGRTYDQYLGLEALRRVGARKWSARVELTFGVLYALTHYDKLYVGGGNASRLTIQLPANVALVSNEAGLAGGVRLWDPDMILPLPIISPTASEGARRSARSTTTKRSPCQSGGVGQTERP